MIQTIKKLKTTHSGIYEFIMFNLLSNVATITNFLVLNLSRSFLFDAYSKDDFIFWIFDYKEVNGGLGGFLAFLLSYACAQSVNFIVQRKLVFNSNSKLRGAIPIYIITISIVYIICLYIPTIVLEPLTSIVGSFWAINLANVINIVIQVIVMYPILKFVVMKKADETV